jgi:hypothetical protein
VGIGYRVYGLAEEHVGCRLFGDRTQESTARVVGKFSKTIKNGPTESFPTIEIPRPGYFLGSDHHLALRFSAQNKSIKLRLAPSAVHKPDLS